jgi:hypothetical protein
MNALRSPLASRPVKTFVTRLDRLGRLVPGGKKPDAAGSICRHNEVRSSGPPAIGAATIGTDYPSSVNNPIRQWSY